MRPWQNLVTSSYSIHTSPIYKQSSVCHADTIQLLHVADTEQSVRQTCSPISTHGEVSVSDYTVLIHCAPEMSEIDCIGRIESFWPKFVRGW